MTKFYVQQEFHDLIPSPTDVNPSGSDSLTVTVDSESPATLISGQDGYLVCTFTPASPTFIVTWRKETYTVYTKLQVMGSVLTSVAYGSLVGRAEIVDDVTLKIKGVQHSDAATYECEVSDMSGSDSGESSAFVEVFVVDDPSPPECTLSSDNLIAGTNESLSCSSIAGRPASSLQWYQQLGDGTLREVGNNMADGSVLTHDLQVTKQDGGTVYICQEEHPEPITSKNCSVTLDVSHLDTPIINATSPVAIHEGTPLFLQCTVDSRPAADIMWLLPSGESVHGADLELPAVGRRHDGVYSCVANMTVGGVELVTGETVEVTVTGNARPPSGGITDCAVRDRIRFKPVRNRIQFKPVRDRIQFKPVRDRIRFKPVRDRIQFKPVRDRIRFKPVRDRIRFKRRN
ncbi:PREDICTED: cell adhesion molecule 1-like [Branchiostoma belcheri]|uniref:Cell adhesion molecule 1-like n=1 Tax=Branchiostoma belcheri TaxID=7741 RepID=A0A6P4YK80_BRABE|nr:PREDICTED: cell adhesion molecule 1-like [Branchiostoma belcheri]